MRAHPPMDSAPHRKSAITGSERVPNNATMAGAMAHVPRPAAPVAPTIPAAVVVSVARAAGPTADRTHQLHQAASVIAAMQQALSRAAVSGTGIATGPVVVRAQAAGQSIRVVVEAEDSVATALVAAVRTVVTVRQTAVPAEDSVATALVAAVRTVVTVRQTAVPAPLLLHVTGHTTIAPVDQATAASTVAPVGFGGVRSRGTAMPSARRPSLLRLADSISSIRALSLSEAAPARPILAGGQATLPMSPSLSAPHPRLPGMVPAEAIRSRPVQGVTPLP